MIELLPSERFHEISIDVPLSRRYAVSNYGRLASYTETLKEGNILKGGLSDGYQTFSYAVRTDGKRKTTTSFVCKLVAKYFLEKPSEEHKYVLHLDYKRDNDKVLNLKWATREEMLEHGRKSPHVIAVRKGTVASKTHKLTTTQVMHLKKRLLDPNRKTRIKILAKQFGVSEMQLHRIKTGENWGHIKV